MFLKLWQGASIGRFWQSVCRMVSLRKRWAHQLHLERYHPLSVAGFLFDITGFMIFPKICQFESFLIAFQGFCCGKGDFLVKAL